jgi:coproporphyrinogen III oxidase-like Fe-S oxidoreductase
MERPRECYQPHNGHGYVKVDSAELTKDIVTTRTYKFKYHEHVYGYLGYDVIGFGVNAISSTSGYSIQNVGSREKYIKSILIGDLTPFVVYEHLPEIDAARPLALHLPYHGYVAKAELDWAKIPAECVKALDELCEVGLISESADALHLTHEGWQWYVNVMHYLLPESQKAGVWAMTKKALYDKRRDIEELTIPQDALLD